MTICDKCGVEAVGQDGKCAYCKGKGHEAPPEPVKTVADGFDAEKPLTKKEKAAAAKAAKAEKKAAKEAAKAEKDAARQAERDGE